MLTASIRKRLSPGFSLDVEFTAAAGTTIVFGASGSGKTTLLRSLAGLVTPDEGRIAVGHRVLFDSATGQHVPVRRRRIGYVFQDLALFPHLTIAENIEFGLLESGSAARRARAQGIAESFHIGRLLQRKPDAVSGGERQRAALARALVTDPELLLLDEPLSALDHATQSRIMDDLRAWNSKRRIPIIYVTHAHREVFGLGEHVLVFERGRVVAAGTPYEVMEMPAHEPIAQLAGFENFFGGWVTACRVDAGTMTCRLDESGTEIEVPLGAGGVGAPVRIALRAGDILLAREAPRGISARNILPGRLSRLSREGPVMIAGVEAGEHFIVHLTPGAAESLELRIGDAVWLIIKTHSCRIVSVNRSEVPS